MHLGILSYEEIQILDTITDEIEYMREDEDFEDSNSTEYEELKDLLSHSGISLVDYKIHGDSGMPIVSLYYDSSINKWIYQKPIESSNRVRQKEFDTFDDAKEFLVKIL